MDGPGTAGSHAQATALAKHRIDFRLVGERSFFRKRGGRIGTDAHTHAAAAAIERIGFGHVSAGINLLASQQGNRP